MVCILCNFYILSPVPYVLFLPIYFTRGISICFMFFGVVVVLLSTIDLRFFFPVQDFNALVRYLNQFSPDQFLTAMSNFHLLVFLATCDMLPLKVSTASR